MSACTTTRRIKVLVDSFLWCEVDVVKRNPQKKTHRNHGHSLQLRLKLELLVHTQLIVAVVPRQDTHEPGGLIGKFGPSALKDLQLKWVSDEVAVQVGQ